MRIEAIAAPFFATPPARSSLSPYAHDDAGLLGHRPQDRLGDARLEDPHRRRRPSRAATGSGRPWPWLPIAERLSYSSRVSWTQASGRA